MTDRRDPDKRKERNKQIADALLHRIIGRFKNKYINSVAPVPLAEAIFAAEKVLPIYETEHPDNPAPRNAIAAAKAWLDNPCRETVDAAAAATYKKEQKT